MVPNRFIVQVEIGLRTRGQMLLLEETVNYVSVYALIRTYFDKPVAMLETLAYDLAHDIKRLSDVIQSVEISVEKSLPPVLNMRGGVSVSFRISE